MEQGCMPRSVHVFLFKLLVQRPAVMVSIPVDMNEAPAKKVRIMNNPKTESCKPESYQADELNRQTPLTFKWLRQSTAKTVSRQTRASKTSARKTSSVTPSEDESSSGYKQTNIVQAPEAPATPIAQPLTGLSAVQSGMSKVVPKFHSRGFISSFVPNHVAKPVILLQANNHTINPGLRTQGNSHFHTTSTTPGKNLQATCDATNVTSSSHLQANSQTNYSITSSFFPSLTAGQPYSQLARDSFLQPTNTFNPHFGSVPSFQNTFFQGRPSPNVNNYGSQVSRNYNSQSSSQGAHLSTGGPTCPELMRTTRHWHTIQQTGTEAGSLEFTVMSYNILSQELLTRHMHLYSNCREYDLAWETRGPVLLTQIIAHNADVICLQEVQEDHWVQDIRDVLVGQGYQAVYKKPEGEKPDGCAILFKVSKFRQLKFVPVEFMKEGILDRSNVGIILLLQPLPEIYGGSVKKMCVATTHLLFNPKRGDIKLAQLVLFLAEIDKHAYEQDDLSGTKHLTSSSDSSLHFASSSLEKQSTISDGLDVPGSPIRKGDSHSRHLYCPIILCGDFNTEPYSDLYRFVTGGYLRYDHLVARLVCGQREGQQGGTNRKVDRLLLPDSLSISETCQYIKVLNKRQKNRGGASRHHKVNSGKFFHGMNFKSVYDHYVNRHGRSQKEVSSQHDQCSCTVDYIFYSTSGTRLEQLSPVVDTQANEAGLWLDDSPPDNQQEMRTPKAGLNEADTVKEPLELLARYSLLTTSEAARYGPMPNSTLPSDHLCLIARFRLR